MKRTTMTVLIAALALVGAACGKTKSTESPPGATGSATPTGAFGLTKDAAIAAEVPSSIAGKGSVTVATDASYAPDEFVAADGKTIEGMDVDLGQAIGAVLGLKFNFVNATFATIIPGLAAGKFDLGISSFNDNAEREKTVDFVTYYQAGASIFVSASTSNSFTTLDELCGKAVSVEKGTTELDDANGANVKCSKEGKKKINVLIFDDQNATNLAVITGRAVASLADSQVAQYQVKQTGGKIKITGEYLAPVPYGIAIPRAKGAPKGSGPFTKAIFDALNKVFSSGAYKQVLDKWGIGAGAITAPKINAPVTG